MRKNSSSGVKYESQYQAYKTSLNCSQEERESFARETLLSLTDAPDNQKHHGKTRESYNTSEITCWNQNYLNILTKKELQNNKKKYQKFRSRLKKTSPKESSFLESQSFHFNLNQSIQNGINFIKAPLRQKTQNSQIQEKSFETEKQRTKTKNQILLQIINCKQEITPIMHSTAKKTKYQWKCFSVAKERDEGRHYHRIRRKELNSNQNQNDENATHITKGKSLLVNKTTYNKDILDMRGRSIKKLFAE